MGEFKSGLKRFERRVRWVRAWKWAALGAFSGAIVATILATLDWIGALFTDWWIMGVAVAAGAIVGAVAGFVWRLSTQQVAESVDRRAGLENRLGTAMEDDADDGFRAAQREDARRSFEAVQPKEIFPVRFVRWHPLTLLGCVVAASVFLLGNSALLESDSERAEKDALVEKAAEVRRIADPLQDPDGTAPEEADALAAELERLARELERRRLTQEEAMQRANELSAEAERLAEERLAKASDQIQTAADALADMANMADGDEPVPLSPEVQQALQEMLQNSEELSQGARDLAEAMAEGGEAAEAAMSELSDAELQELLSEIADQRASDTQSLGDMGFPSEPGEAREGERPQMSEEMRQQLREFLRSEAYQELQELLQEMREAVQKMQDGQELTDEEMSALQQGVDELAEQLPENEVGDQIENALRNALAQLEAGDLMTCTGGQCNNLFGLGVGVGGTGSQELFPDLESLNMSDEEMELEGSTREVTVRGQRDASRGSETYVEIKAPTRVGDRSSVPYQDVLPRYREAAESAVDRATIPREHQEKVMNYFDSLAGKEKDRSGGR